VALPKVLQTCALMPYIVMIGVLHGPVHVSLTTIGATMRTTLSTISAINLNHPGRYVHWGVIQISVANLVLILLMVALFAAAILLPFPGTRRRK